jgi:hypothetical protein
MTGTLIPLEDESAWSAALEGVPHAFAHRNDHCRAFAASSGLPTFLYAAEFAGQRIACPLSVRTFDGETDVVTPYGFAGFAASGPTPGFAAAWRSFASRQGWVCGYLQGNPSLLDPLAEEPGVAATDLYLLDLAPDEDSLLAAMSKGRRHQLRRGEDWDIGEAGSEAADFLVREAPGFFAARSASSLYQFRDATWTTLLASPAVLALEARRGGGVCSVSLFGRTGTLADYLFNVSVDEGRDASAALVWNGICRLKAQGARTLNLGGGIRPDDEVAAFKRRFGASPMPLIVRKQVYRPDAFASLCAKAGVAASITASYFPPYYATLRR